MNPIIKPISVVLKEVRQNKGISLDEVYKATKIHPKILRALEEGTTLDLSHIYVKSYIKLYAKYLGISQQELDKYFHPVVPKEKKVHLDMPFRTKGIKIKNLSKLYLLSYLRFQIKRFRKIIVIFIIFLALVLLIVLFRKAHRKDAVILEKVTLDDSSFVSQTADAKNNKAKEIKEGFPSKIDDVLRLTIFAKQDTWMQIKKDGEIVFKRILKKAT